MKKLILLLSVFLLFILSTSLIHGTEPCLLMPSYDLRDYKVITDLNLIPINKYVIDIKSSDKFLDNFIFKTINISGQEEIIDISKTHRSYGIKTNGQWGEVELYLPLMRDCAKGLNIYKKDTGQLVYSSRYKIFYSPDISCEESRELCPEVSEGSIKKIINWFKKIFG